MEIFGFFEVTYFWFDFFQDEFYSTALKTLISVSTVILLGLIVAYHALEVQVMFDRMESFQMSRQSANESGSFIIFREFQLKKKIIFKWRNIYIPLNLLRI